MSRRAFLVLTRFGWGVGGIAGLRGIRPFDAQTRLLRPLLGLTKAEILKHLEGQAADIMLKLTIPTQDGLYDDLADHPRVVRVVALSGGYSREEANARLSRNAGVVASFSRALTEGLSAQQSDAEFNASLDASIQSIYDASAT